jgi:deoxyribose-phosphate aldolase
MSDPFSVLDADSNRRAAARPDPATARRLVSLVDLTSLNAADDENTVARLAALAVSPAGRVAALCVWARLLGAARAALAGSGVPVAVVANFPDGTATAAQVAAETAAAVAAGADEVDVVFPYRALLAGDAAAGASLLSACRAACAPRTVLKVILETGQLGTAQHVAHAAAIAIAGGADFLKTSTGKTTPGVTPAAVAVLLDVIAAAAARDRPVGLKVSGGIRTAAEACALLGQFEHRFGAGSATPLNFRIGASTLLAELIALAE